MNWDEIFNWSIAVVLLAIIVSLFIYGFSTKHHAGYYLTNSAGVYKVWVNWENAPDGVAIRTYKKVEAIEALERLNGCQTIED